jgi:hypothetical protein
MHAHLAHPRPVIVAGLQAASRTDALSPYQLTSRCRAPRTEFNTYPSTPLINFQPTFPCLLSARMSPEVILCPSRLHASVEKKYPGFIKHRVGGTRRCCCTVLCVTERYEFVSQYPDLASSLRLAGTVMPQNAVLGKSLA